MLRPSNLPALRTFPRSPFKRFDDMRTEMESFLPELRFWGEREMFFPKMDVFEQKGEMVVRADLPGMKKADVEVMIENGDLVLKGERKIEKEVQDESFYRAERAYGEFFRRVPLPAEVKMDKVAANFKDGVLEIHVPLPAEAKTATHKIPVN